MKEAFESNCDPYLPGSYLLIYGLISCQSAFNMQPDGIFDELACFFFGLPFGIAALKGRANGHKPAILVSLNHNREFIVLQCSSASPLIVYRLPHPGSCHSILANRMAWVQLILMPRGESLGYNSNSALLRAARLETIWDCLRDSGLSWKN